MTLIQSERNQQKQIIDAPAILFTVRLSPSAMKITKHIVLLRFSKTNVNGSRTD